MNLIEIKLKEEAGHNWLFWVGVRDREYRVTVDKDYWVQLTQRRIEPAELVRRSFEFLLAREPKESILPKFNLQVINEYFPEYEKEIKKQL